MQFSADVANARIDTIFSTIGASATIKIFDGTLPTDCAAADDGNVLTEFPLSTAWLNAASSGIAAFADVPINSTASLSGTPEYFRVYDSSTAPACKAQGTVGVSGSGADMIITSETISSGEAVNILSMTLDDGTL